MFNRHALHFILISFIVLFSPVVSSQDKSNTGDNSKAVLVTGASSGIGLRITEHLTAQGYFVYAGARKDVDLKRLNMMKNVEAVRLDVNKQEQIDAAVKQIEKGGRGLYGLVNNAGVAIISPLIETEESDMDFQLQVNVYGPYRVTKAFAPMIIKEKGRITTTGSISGILSGSLFGPYSMSKHAMEAFTDSLSREMEKFGVKVSIIEPGNYRSKIGQSLSKRFKNKNVNLKASRYQPEMERMYGFFDNKAATSNEADPIAVAKAVEDALFSEKPKLRYMVVPNQRQAEITIRKAMEEMLQLNHDQAYSYDREALIKMLDETLNKVAGSTE